MKRLLILLIALMFAGPGFAVSLGQDSGDHFPGAVTIAGTLGVEGLTTVTSLTATDTATITNTGTDVSEYGVKGNATGAATFNRGIHGNASGASSENSGVYGIVSGTTGSNNRGLYGSSIVTAGNGVGVWGNASGACTDNYGVYSLASGATTNYGIRAIASGAGATNTGIRAEASGATTNYAGYFVGDVEVTGDIYTTAWTDSGGTTSTVGWVNDPPATKSLVFTKKVGNRVDVEYRLKGTSNATTVSFTLPFTSVVSDTQFANAAYCIDNGGNLAASGMSWLGGGSNTVSIYTDWAFGAWTNSGVKEVRGQFWYEAQ